MKKSRHSIIYKTCIVIYISTSILGFVINFKNHDMNGLEMGFVALLTPFIVPLIFKLFHLKMNDEVKVVNLVFIYFASLLGSGFHFYQYPYYDKLLHFSSGIFGLLLSVFVFCKLTQKKKITNQTLFYLFINFMNMSIALCWEFYEYSMLVFFNNDCINHTTTGVHDSLTDMLCATIVGLWMTYFIYRFNKTKKSTYLIRMTQKLIDDNIE